MTALAARRALGARKPGLLDRDRSILLHDISWDAYDTIREALRDRPIFLTFDQGTLEIMVLSAEHEQFKSKLARLVSILAKHFRKNFASFGSFTQQREHLLKGIETDDCFYIDSLPLVLGKKHIDLERDPPPDLALEIDIAHSSIERLPIFAALKIPEIWRFDGASLFVHVLANSTYELRDASPTFPTVSMAKLVDFIYLGLEKGEMVMWEEFEKWLQGLSASKKRQSKKRKPT